MKDGFLMLLLAVTIGAVSFSSTTSERSSWIEDCNAYNMHKVDGKLYVCSEWKEPAKGGK